MDVFSLLKKEHKKVAGLFKDIEGLTKSTISKKEALFRELKTDLTKHADFEEQNLYPVIKDPEKTHDLTLESYEEHRLIRQLLDELTRMPENKDEWDAKFKVLREQVEHHVEEEEGELFPKAKKVLSEEQIDDLTIKLERFKVRMARVT
jgi:hemerythrin-like domain-containing protein